MGRLIDEQTAYTVLTEYYHHTTDTQHAALKEALGRVETVDAEPVRHGHWIYHPEWVADGECGYECSECGMDRILTTISVRDAGQEWMVNMKKLLIELDAALDALREVIVPAEDIGFGDELTDGYNDGIDMAVTVVSALPTVDAVEVVRCKDCKHYQFADNRAFDFPVKRCEWTGFEDVDDYDYCSYGERKDGDGHED